jgi:hypothetical protein
MPPRHLSRALVVEPKNSATSKTGPLHGVSWYDIRGPGRVTSDSSVVRPIRRRPRTPTYHACSVRRVSGESSLSDANFGLLPPRRRVGLPAGWPIARGAMASVARGCGSGMAGHCVSRQASENRGETRFRPRRPSDRAWPQGPCGTGPLRRADPRRAPLAGLGISPASYCRSASRAGNMRISQKPEVPVSAPRIFTPSGGRDRAGEGRRE